MLDPYDCCTVAVAAVAVGTLPGVAGAAVTSHAHDARMIRASSAHEHVTMFRHRPYGEIICMTVAQWQLRVSILRLILMTVALSCYVAISWQFFLYRIAIFFCAHETYHTKCRGSLNARSRQ